MCITFQEKNKYTHATDDQNILVEMCIIFFGDCKLAQKFTQT
jgi:hypothetical protein